MNWYKKSKNIKALKTGQTKSDNLTSKLSWDYKSQNMNKLEFGDTMRYSMDSHDINLAMNKTDEEIIVSITMGSAYVGTYILDSFWSFDLEEENKAKKLYNNLVAEIKPVLKKFVKEKIPTSLLTPFLRKIISKLSKENYIRTNIPVVNYSYDLPLEEDWRETIYGKRYPKYKEESFKQYLNNSIYSDGNNAPTGKFSF